MANRAPTTMTTACAALLVGASASLVHVSSLAAEDCLRDKQVEISRALGVVFAEQVLARYGEFIDLDAVEAGMRSRVAPEKSASSAVKDAMSDIPDPAEAKKLLGEGWEEMPDDGKRYVAALHYLAALSEQDGTVGRQARGTVGKTESGALYRVLYSPTDENASGEAEWTNIMEDCGVAGSSTKGKFDVCYSRKKIPEKDLCSTDKLAPEDFKPLTTVSGKFDASEVIEGWAELFEAVEEGEIDRGSIIEAVIPPALAYGAKGVPGEVEPDETLRFVMRVGRPSEKPGE